ncbi:MAG TPA: hypothetical protein VJB06_04570, partial [archaeon]|nr:hypothetical protein [archaeon]
SENNAVSETVETKGVERQLSFSRDIEVPSFAAEDNYVAYVEVSYQDSVAIASQLFRVNRSPGSIPIGPTTYMAIIIIIIIGVFMVRFHIRRKGLEKGTAGPRKRRKI